MKLTNRDKIDLHNGKGLPNQGEYQTLSQRCGAEATRLVQELGQVERLLSLTNEVLKVTQPPINGKLGVQWWQENGRNPWRDPVLVKWMRRRNGKKQAVRIKHLHPRLVRTAGTSKYGAEETLDLARMAVRLIAAYKEVRSDLLALCRLAARRRRAVVELLVEAPAAIAVNHEIVMEHLIAAGYDIDAKTMKLTQPLYADV